MSNKIKFIDLNYYYHSAFTAPGEAILKHEPSNLFATPLTRKASIVLVKHINYTGKQHAGGVSYQFFRSKNKFLHIPFATHRFIKKEKPDMVLVQGLIFPLKVIALRMKLGKHCKIVLQHQGERPFRRKIIFQKMADKFVDGYFFTARGNTNEWINAGVIRGKSKCYEIPDASTLFCRQEKAVCRQRTGMTGALNFLWVSRLNENKDPFTVLSGFEKYFAGHPTAKLYMIYSEEPLLEQVKERILKSPTLKDRVILVGRVRHDQLQDWYSAADYYVSGSRREGGGYALTEAMACGCIPVVSNIPPFMKSIDNGRAGYYYPAGDSDALFQVLAGLDPGRQQEMSLAAQTQFRNHLSPPAIADKIFAAFEDLKLK